eukprot:1876501-Pyramimonas_sp.AAC.1
MRSVGGRSESSEHAATSRKACDWSAAATGYPGGGVADQSGAAAALRGGGAAGGVGAAGGGQLVLAQGAHYNLIGPS